MVLGKLIVASALLTGLAAISLPFLWDRLFPLEAIPREFYRDGYWGPAKVANSNPPDDNPQVVPFQLSVPEEVLKDLKGRLRATRYAPVLQDSDSGDDGESAAAVGFRYGFPSSELRSWVAYWADEYDWRAQERLINSFPAFKTQIEGLDVHFLHVRPAAGRVPPGAAVYPLMLLHGWPGSFVEFLKIIPMLTEGGGGQEKVFFELIIPSLPGYGLSEAPHRPGCDYRAVGRMFVKLARRLGHERFFVQGGDWGSLIGHTMALLWPENVRGVHMNFAPMNPTAKFYGKVALGALLPSLVFHDPAGDTAMLYPFLAKMGEVMGEEMGYAHIQGTKPDTVGAGLTDSPAGLAAYILEKFSTWTDKENRGRRDGGLSLKWGRDELLTNLMIYWISGNVAASQRFYKENMLKLFFQRNPLNGHKVMVPAGVADFPNEIVRHPRALLELSYERLVHYSRMERGGHFAAMEEPRLLADDIRQFVRTVLTTEQEDLQRAKDQQKAAEDQKRQAGSGGGQQQKMKTSEAPRTTKATAATTARTPPTTTTRPPATTTTSKPSTTTTTPKATTTTKGTTKPPPPPPTTTTTAKAKAAPSSPPPTTTTTTTTTKKPIK